MRNTEGKESLVVRNAEGKESPVAREVEGKDGTPPSWKAEGVVINEKRNDMFLQVNRLRSGKILSPVPY